MKSTQELNRPALSHFPLLSYILALKRPNFHQRIKMSSTSESEMSFDSDDSDINFIPEVEIANARQRATV